jgi:beta-glucosidase
VRIVVDCFRSWLKWLLSYSSHSVQADHYKLIREIGAASIVMLKNTNRALPLSVGKIKRASLFKYSCATTLTLCATGLAILGEDAGPNPDGPNGCGESVIPDI